MTRAPTTPSRPESLAAQRWRRVRYPLYAAIVVVAIPVTAAQAQTVSDGAGVTGDVFSTQGEPENGGDVFSTGDLPGVVEGGPCEDTSRYDQIYGGPPVRLRLDALGDEIYQRHPDILLRCAADRCALNETAICWLNQAAIEDARNDPPPADEFYTGTPSGSGAYDPNLNPNQDPWGDGGKSVYRTWDTPTIPAAGADATIMVATLDRCAREGGLSYYTTPGAVTFGGTVAYDTANAVIGYNPGRLNREPPYIRAYLLANAYAVHILALESRRYGPPGTQYQRDVDYITGYLSHCLAADGLLPPARGANDPRNQYEDIIWPDGTPVAQIDPAITAARRKAFSDGWGDFGMRFSPEFRHE